MKVTPLGWVGIAVGAVVIYLLITKKSLFKMRRGGQVKPQAGGCSCTIPDGEGGSIDVRCPNCKSKGCPCKDGAA